MPESETPQKLPAERRAEVKAMLEAVEQEVFVIHSSKDKHEHLDSQTGPPHKAASTLAGRSGRASPPLEIRRSRADSQRSSGCGIGSRGRTSANS